MANTYTQSTCSHFCRQEISNKKKSHCVLPPLWSNTFRVVKYFSQEMGLFNSIYLLFHCPQ